MHTHEHLLQQTSTIIRQYDKIAELTGENFNIFKILGLSTSEVRTHSALLSTKRKLYSQFRILKKNEVDDL